MVCKWSVAQVLETSLPRFNPCYVGLWSVSGCGTLLPMRMAGFNPCYVGLWSVSAFICFAVSTNSCFNPCYVGLWSVSCCIDYQAYAGYSFNPCYVGLWSVRVVLLSGSKVIYQFQSLLCWIMVCKMRTGWSWRRASTRFNPCYVGLWSVSSNPFIALASWLSFNPCYVGLWSVRAEAPRSRGHLVTVSILVMLDYGL